MDAEAVAIYLKTHPEFFSRYGEMLADIRVPSNSSGSVASLAERQVSVLREKTQILEDKMRELLRFGEQNDSIAEKVHRLGVALIEAMTLEETVQILHSHLGGAFAVPHVKVRLWGVGGEDNAGAEEFNPVSDTLKGFSGGLMNPFCGSSFGQESVQWFDENAGNIRSVAQVPLREHGYDGGVCFGLLVLASEEVSRFYPDMGVLYLTRIGDMASAALLRVVG